MPMPESWKSEFGLTSEKGSFRDLASTKLMASEGSLPAVILFLIRICLCQFASPRRSTSWVGALGNLSRTTDTYVEAGSETLKVGKAGFLAFWEFCSSWIRLLSMAGLRSIRPWI